jgi:hypothetical protein
MYGFRKLHWMFGGCFMILSVTHFGADCGWLVQQVLIDAVEQMGGIYLITADHGNCDDMAQRKKTGEPLRDETGRVAPLTSHTLAPV